jgi:ribosomal protein S14
MNLSLYSVAGFLVMDTDGNRVMAKYYRPKHNPLLTPLPDTKQLSNLKEQKAFEKGLWEKTKKPGGMYNRCINVFDERHVFTRRLIVCRRCDHLRFLFGPLQALIGFNILRDWSSNRK